jgi:hypothetical protein
MPKLTNMQRSFVAVGANPSIERTASGKPGLAAHYSLPLSGAHPVLTLIVPKYT